MEMNENEKINHLEEFGKSNFELADGQPDIIGYTVYTAENTRIGKVSELLISEQECSVLYLAVELNKELASDHRSVLIPVGGVELHHDIDDVLITDVTGEQIAMLPGYSGGPVLPTMEAKILQVFSTDDNDHHGHAGFYSSQHFNQNRIYHSRGGYTEAEKVIKKPNSNARREQ